MAKEIEAKHCNRWHCNTTRNIWDRCNSHENSFARFTSAQPIEKSKEWHASVKINEREYLIHRL